MPHVPRIAVVPAPESSQSGDAGWIQEAVTLGGGELVGPERAEGLVWVGASPADLGALLAEHSGIRWVQLPSAGVDPYVEAKVLDADRLWTCAKGVYARPVAEHALTLALAGLRDLKRHAHARAWGEQAGISLAGGRVTIFGAGGICRELVSLLRPFGCAVTVVRRQRSAMDGVERVLSFGERYEALKGADVVILALALTNETRGLVGSIELELMEPHAWLVNVARGPHVVTDDLVQALREQTIGGAALDVTEPEPLPADHPLWDLPNCLVTPHTASTGDMTRPLLGGHIADNVRRFSLGEPLLGLVDPAAGY